ncbi:unnamed protein product [Porites lobata]|uniref:Uncharacterized protein n=1 Tax=Porites lobata TaxID=104759 RepID=A0ABN8PEP4_9CNID|nr:unnamed protein product [Porites lobata]
MRFSGYDAEANIKISLAGHANFLPGMPGMPNQLASPSACLACQTRGAKTGNELPFKPKVKKDFLDPEQYSNFISNLKFACKINEKAVACQLKDCLTDNNLDVPIQSAYKSTNVSTVPRQP